MNRTAEKIFLAAIELPQAKREAYLERHCGGDPELREAVDTLLENYAKAKGKSFLDTPVLRRTAGSAGIASADETPRRIGSYRIVGELGRGGMGVVYRAIDSKLERHVALKVLSMRLAHRANLLARFEREAKLLATLNHPNIAMIHSLEESDGQPFLTMELVPGQTLRERIAQGRLPVEESLRVCAQMAAAVEAAHARGIIHRDLKPGNIMLALDGSVKVLDFGIAKVVSAREDEHEDDPTRPTTVDALGDRVVQPGDGAAEVTIVGTPGYMSPEVLEGRLADQRADLWGIGCVLFECLTGQKAFGGQKAEERDRATLTRDPDWTILPHETPDVVRTLLRSCLSKDVLHRANSAESVREALESGASAVSDHLPVPMTSFIGREDEVLGIGRLLGDHRVVTLTGFGGVGKTRLALQVARLSEGAAWVELASVSSPNRVAAAIATSLRVDDAAAASVVDAIAAHLGQRRVLLVLDNCEHVLEGCRQLVTDLVQRARGVRILATSREPLGLIGERVCPISPLEVPSAEEAGAGASPRDFVSAKLFCERAAAARGRPISIDRDAAWVYRIVRRLEGIPLAIELAAARAGAMNLEQIARRLDERFRLLQGKHGSAVDRQRTMMGALEWSHDLLDPLEQRVFRRLCVFRGGFSLEGAAAVSGARTDSESADETDVLEAVSALVEKSLVMMSETGAAALGPRYTMLETLREFGEGKLDAANETALARKAHLDHFAHRAADTDFRAPDPKPWLDLWEQERENVIAAVTVGGDVPGCAPQALRLAGLLAPFWEIRGGLTQGAAILERALTRPGSQSSNEDRRRALNGAGAIATSKGDLDAARRWLEESIEIGADLGDERSSAVSLGNLASVCFYQDDPERAREYGERALEILRRIGSEREVASVLYNLGLAALRQEDETTARRLHEQSLEHFKRANDRRGTAAALTTLAKLASNRGDHLEARRLAEQGLDIWREMGDRRGTASALVHLAMVLHGQGIPDRVASLLQEGLVIARETGDRHMAANAFDLLGVVAQDDGNDSEAHRLYRESLSLRWEIGNRQWIAVSLRHLALLSASRGWARHAAWLLSAAEATRESASVPIDPDTHQQVATERENLRERLGDAAFSRVWEAGAAASLREVVERALSEGGPETPPPPAS